MRGNGYDCPLGHKISKQIASIQTMIEAHDKMLSDNGGPGLYQTVIKLKENVEEYARIQEEQTKNINTLYRTVDNLVKYRIATEKEEEVIIKMRKERDEEKLRKRKYQAGMIIAFVSAGVTIVLFIIDKIWSL